MMTVNYLNLMIIYTALLLSVICIIGGSALRLFYHREIPLTYLGWATLLTAVWSFSNSVAGQYLFPVAAEYLAFFTTIFLPLPFFLYLNLLQRKRYQKLYQMAVFVLLLETVVFTILLVTGIRSAKEAISIVLFLFAPYQVLMIATSLIDLYNKQIQDYLFASLGLTFIGFICLARLPFFLLNLKQRDNALLPFGLILLLVLAMLNTIQELIQMERQRQRALAASDAKGRFLANMSHEIRTPINAVLGMDTMILRETKEPQIKEYALDIQNAGQSLLSLINDILDLSKIESGKLELIEEEYDFSSLIHDIMNMISMKAENKGLSVHLSIEDQLPSRLWGDDVRLRQVLINLMNNAVKYTEQGSVTLSVQGHSDPGTNTVSLTFHVTDTGIGIKQEDISKLFAEFERIEEQRNRNIEGTGLGMSITTQLLTLMGSSLQVESVYSKGSDFYFTLEQKIINAEPIGNLEERIRNQAKEYSYQTMLTAPDAHVLVVDDNAMNRRVFKNLLKETLVQIDEAGGGMECLALTRQNCYDLIFLDHMMPDMDGIETLHRLMEDADSLCGSTPVIALTANAITGAKEMYLSEGFHSFLSKPINPEKLEQLLLDLLPEDKKVACEISGDGADMPTPDSKTTPEHEFPEIDGLDWDYASLHLKDPELLFETIRDFYLAMDTDHDMLLQFLEQIQTADAEALRQFKVRVHSMKSSAALIGATSLSGIAKMLEYAARDGRTDIIFSISPFFLEEWQHMKERLRPLVDEPTGQTDSQKPQADLKIIQEYFPMLEQAMQSMNVDTADEIMRYLETFQYPEPVHALIGQLGLSVTNLDAERTTKTIEDLKKVINNTETN